MMRLYWRFSSLPELGHLSPEDRRDLIHRTRATAIWLGMMVKAALWSVVTAGFLSAVLQQRGLATTTALACAAVALVITFALVFQIQFIRQRSQLRLELMKSLPGERLPICLKCGYNQSANTTDRCAECGALIRVP